MSKSKHITMISKAPSDHLKRFALYLERLYSTLAPKTKQYYRSAVRDFARFVQDRDFGEDAFRIHEARNQAVLAYKRYLIQDLKRSPQTINRVLTGLNHFYEMLGIGPPMIAKLKQPRYPVTSKKPLDRVFVPYSPGHLRLARHEKGYTLRDLADHVQTRYGYLSELGNGKYDPTLEGVRNLGRALDVIFTVGEGTLMEMNPRAMKIFRQGQKYDGKRLTLRRVAALSGISYNTVRDFERERAQKSRVSTVEKLSGYYGLRLFLL